MEEKQEQPLVWMPIKTFYCKELRVAELLRKEGIEYYLPMVYELQETKDKEHKCEHVLVPAIHNLLFIRHTYNKSWCRKFARNFPLPIYFMKRERDCDEFCIVPDDEMQNFIRATDPNIQGTRFIDSEKLKNKKGFPVRIAKKGPLYGITGKFIRYGGRHYIAIEMNNSTALLKVSYTWCEEISGNGAHASETE